MNSLRLKLIYEGSGPAHWCRRPEAFGLQDKEERLHAGVATSPDVIEFELELQIKPGELDPPVLLGPFAHGPPGARFLYLGWRDERGAFAQRLKLPLGSISWADIRESDRRGEPLLGRLVDRHPRVTSTGANIGGTRPMTWALA